MKKITVDGQKFETVWRRSEGELHVYDAGGMLGRVNVRTGSLLDCRQTDLAASKALLQRVHAEWSKGRR